MTLEHAFVEELVRDLVGIVVAPENLLEDHGSLDLDVLGAERRVSQHVAKDRDPFGNCLSWEANVEDRLLFGRVGVHIAAGSVNGLGYRSRATGCRALE